MSTKEKILEILNSNLNQVVSGEVLATECGVSRAAIWKAITALRNQGCNIDGTTNGGYVLSGAIDIFSKENFSAHLLKFNEGLKNSHIECFAQIDSTNTYAKRLLSECGNLRDHTGSLTQAGQKYHKSIYVAESQTAGRGRLGRTFYSPAKTGIYLTIVYAPQHGIRQPAKMTAYSAVAVARALKELYNIDAQIKWINDIFINGKKVSGILTEGFTNFETGTIESAIIGIGINISDNPDIFPEEVQKIAGSIKGTDSEKGAGRSELAACVAANVIRLLDEDAEDTMQEYRKRSLLIGKSIKVHPVIDDAASVYDAKVVDVDDCAGLVVELSDGTRKTLSSGEVSIGSDKI